VGQLKKCKKFIYYQIKAKLLMLTISITFRLALLPLLLIIINSPPAAYAGNPYGVPPPRPQPQWQRPATQWDANGVNWAGENKPETWANFYFLHFPAPNLAQLQQQQYPQYRAPVVPMPNPPASGQGCYTFPRCPPMLSTAAAAERE
jgi:hypothetical protein